MAVQTKIDPFSAEIIRESLVTVAEEMFVSLQRTSQSTIIYEVLDFACGITDSKAQLIAQTNGVTAFAAIKAHWTEVGGKDAGSWTTDATEVFQEGLQLPCVRLYVDHKPLPSVLDIIRANVRTPEMSL